MKAEGETDEVEGETGDSRKKECVQILKKRTKERTMQCEKF